MKYLCSVSFEIEADSEADVEIELLEKMDTHNMEWEIEPLNNESSKADSEE